MNGSITFPGPKAYTRALARDEELASIPVSMAAALLGVKVPTVQGYLRRGSLREIVVGANREWVGISAADVRAMRANKLERLRRLAKLAEPILLRAAQDRTTVEYGEDLMKPLGLDHRYTRDRDVLGKVLGVISRKSHKRSDCMLTVLAVRKDSGMPNSVFFDFAKDLSVMPSSMSEERFFKRHKKVVFDHYG